jgi:hypothetical protein
MPAAGRPARVVADLLGILRSARGQVGCCTFLLAQTTGNQCLLSPPPALHDIGRDEQAICSAA